MILPGSRWSAGGGQMQQGGLFSFFCGQARGASYPEGSLLGRISSARRHGDADIVIEKDIPPCWKTKDHHNKIPARWKKFVVEKFVVKPQGKLVVWQRSWKGVCWVER
jgi:hypothetical protein